MTPQEFKDFSKLPYIDIPYTTAEKYKGQVAVLMDRLADSQSGKAKELKPKEFKWKLLHRRAEDPKSTTDPEAFTAALCAESEYWLKASGAGWVGYEPISVTPPQFRAQYEQRAKLICGQRVAAKSEEKDDTDIFQESPNGHVDLLGAFDDWCRQHASYDKRIASIARLALIKLVE